MAEAINRAGPSRIRAAKTLEQSFIRLFDATAAVEQLDPFHPVFGQGRIPPAALLRPGRLVRLGGRSHIRQQRVQITQERAPRPVDAPVGQLDHGPFAFGTKALRVERKQTTVTLDDWP